MDYFGDSEIPAMLAEVGQDVVVAGASVKALVSVAGRAIPRGAPMPSQRIGSHIVVAVQSSAFEGTQLNGADVEIDGQAYVVRQALPLGEGALTELTCAVVT